VWLNQIGTSKDGKNAVPNMENGVFLTGKTTENDVSDNLISGNKLFGVTVTGKGTDYNIIRKNKIGTDIKGEGKLPNLEGGLMISDSARKTKIGGDDSLGGNLISGNNGNGVTITGQGTSQTRLMKNLIGTDYSGTKVLANEGHGILISNGASYNYIGGRTRKGTYNLPGESGKFEENVISGNKLNGILITGKGTRRNEIEGNIIGGEKEYGFKKALGNGKNGIEIADGASENVIGASSIYAYRKENSIGHNKLNGIFIHSESGYATGNKILISYIGTNDGGKVDFANEGYGIKLLSGSRNTAIKKNIVNFNKAGGIWDGGQGTVIKGNKIGKNKGFTGIHMDGSNAEIIGNTITGDEHDGIVCENGSNPIIHFNNIYGNDEAELNNLDGSVTIDARYNWWGSADGSGSEITGSVDSSAMLTGEVGEGAGDVLSGENSTTLLNGSVVADYNVAQNLSLDILELSASPYGALENEIGSYYLIMVNDTANLTELKLSFYYTPEDIVGRKPSTLQPSWWTGNEWQEASDWQLDTTSTGNFSGFVSMTIKAGSSPLPNALEQLLVGLSAESGADHEINVTVDEVFGVFEPAGTINITGKITVEPTAQVESVKLFMEGQEIATGTLSGDGYWVKYTLPNDLTEGEYTLSVNVTLENGESGGKTGVFRYQETAEEEEEDDNLNAWALVLILIILVVIILGVLVQQGIILPQEEAGEKKTEAAPGFREQAEEERKKQLAGEDRKQSEDEGKEASGPGERPDEEEQEMVDEKAEDAPPQDPGEEEEETPAVPETQGI
jgi:hypothetical protein